MDVEEFLNDPQPPAVTATLLLYIEELRERIVRLESMVSILAPRRMEPRIVPDTNPVHPYPSPGSYKLAPDPIPIMYSTTDPSLTFTKSPSIEFPSGSTVIKFGDNVITNMDHFTATYKTVTGLEDS